MELIRPSSDLRNKYGEISGLVKETKEGIFITVNGREDSVLMSHTQYSYMKSELELLRTLMEAQYDVDHEQVNSMQSTFDSIRRSLADRRNPNV